MTLLGVSLKAYLSATATRDWAVRIAAALVSRPSAPPVFVLPTAPLIPSVLALVEGTGVTVGAQDVAADEDGARTGETSAALLAEIGCRYAAVGHAERRARFGEDDRSTAAKAANASAHGLIPVVCVGETARGDTSEAIARCSAQADAVLAACGDADLVFAYEPVWAIGADEPAPAEHVAAVATGLRPRIGHASLLYGGSAGPGLFTALSGEIDGLFLGRFAHDPDAFARVLDEMSPLQEETP